jgi:hypothetical protein
MGRLIGLMSLLIASAYLLIAGLGVSQAFACSCERVNPGNASFWISQVEIIADGVVTGRDALASEGNTQTIKLARFRIDHAWKGELPGTVTLKFHESGASCGAPPPLDRPIRVILMHDPGDDRWVFDYGLCSDLLDDARFDPFLAEYSTRTEAMMRSAESQGRNGLLDLARYFQRNHETRRALAIYAALRRDDPDDLDALLGQAVSLRATQDRVAPLNLLDIAKALARTEADRGKLARAAFQITGRIDPDWKDWSGLETYARPTEISEMDLSGAKFDDTLLIATGFNGTQLRGARFLGADLTHASLENAHLEGAFYDCRTRFQKSFDPAAAGMINVERKCMP